MKEIILHLSVPDNAVAEEMVNDLKHVVDNDSAIAISTTRGHYLSIQVDAIEVDS